MIQHHTHFKKYLPLYPLAFRSFRGDPGGLRLDQLQHLRQIHAFRSRHAHRLLRPQSHPLLWQTDEYLDHEVRHSALNRIVRAFLPPFREIDKAAANRMSVLVANSRNVQDRIRRFYGRESLVIPLRCKPTAFSFPPKMMVTISSSRACSVTKTSTLPCRRFPVRAKRLVILRRRPLSRRSGKR